MKCQKCGALLSEGENHCPKCGTDNLTEEPNTSATVAEEVFSKGHSVKRKIIMIIAAIIVLAGGGAAAFAITNYNSPAQKLSRTLSSAESCVSDRNYEQAAIEFQKALEIEPANADSYLGLADSYIALGKTNEAIETLRKGAEATDAQAVRDKLNELVKNSTMDTAQQHLDNKDFEAALEQFKTVIELDEKCTEAYLGYADALVGLDKVDEAIECLEKGYELTQDKKIGEKSKELRITRSLELAEKYMLEKNYSSAQTEFKNVLAADDKCSEAYIGIAEALAKINKIDDAIEILKQGFDKTGDEKIKQKINSLSVSGYLEAAEKYLSEKNYESAITEFEKVLAVDDKSLDAYTGTADAYVALGKTDKAIENLQKGFEKTKDDKLGAKLNTLKIDDFTQKGQSCLEEKKYDDAIKNFQSVLELDKKNTASYAAIADAYIALNNVDKATEILKEGFEETKDKTLEEKLTSVKRAAALSAAQTYYNNGRYSDAVSEFNKILETDEKCVEAYMGLADAYFKLNNDDEALASLRKGYDKTGDAGILSRLNKLSLSSSLELAKKYLSQKEYAKARDEFQNVLNLDSSNVEAYIGKADAYIGLKEFDNANSILQKGWAATWDSRIQNKMFRNKLNTIPLKPQKCGYEPLNEIVEQTLNKITTDDMDTFEKVKACYDYLINTCSYGHADGIQDILEFEDFWDEKTFYEKYAYIILRDHVGVCDNYSAAFAALTRAIGLDTKVRGGQTATASTESGYTGHAWCVVIINGTEYVFDPQVEDNIAKGGPINYYRFCKTYDEVKNQYIPENFVGM